MSAEEDRGIAFSISNDSQKYRLLELPPALLALVSSTVPSSLSLKSAPPSRGDPGNAVLCSHNQTFQLRQVHSSNSIYVLQPAKDMSLTAVSKCEATLEAIPQSPPCIALLRAIIPLYSGEEQASDHTSSGLQSKQSILVDTPISSQEFNRAWINLCAFELDGQAWLPTSSLLWKTWRSIVLASTIKGIPLDQVLDLQSIARTAAVEDEIPIPVFDAVIERLQDESMTKLDALESVRWSGTILLEWRSRAGSPSSIQSFLEDWKEYLPESWRKHAKLEVLKGTYTQPSRDTIIFNNFGVVKGDGAPSTTEAKTTRPPARKWHERFKNSRR